MRVDRPDLAVHARVSVERAAAAYDGTYRGAKTVGAPLGGLLVGAVAYAGMPFGGPPAGALTTVGGRTVTVVVLAGVYLLASVPSFAVPAWRTFGPGPEARTPGRSA
ncbi:hypothetical protein [Actinoallomurus sp. CA-142502]|uniref:hypothetical protein n=1 Tax=Actinoallomurus sp. CA-142502 TaxID=3239885 RepID=UPI003D911F28